jgi:hypothetical protein
MQVHAFCSQAHRSDVDNFMCFQWCIKNDPSRAVSVLVEYDLARHMATLLHLMFAVSDDICKVPDQQVAVRVGGDNHTG